MALYFRLRSVPELRGFPAEVRPVIIRRCFESIRQVPRSSAVGCLLLPMIPVTSILSSAILLTIVDALGPHAAAAEFVMLGSIGIVGGLAVVLNSCAIAADRADLRAGIAAYTIDGRFPVCPACDYDLRGTTGDACPECGARVHLTQ